MHDNASVPARRNSGRTKVILPLGLGAAVLIGIGAWALWPSEGPAVAVPDRVCRGALPGGPVRDLLPEYGEGFDEDVFGSSSATSVSTTWKCTLSAGGDSVHLSAFLIPSEDDYSSQDIARDAAESGNVPLSWGMQKGFIERGEVSLFVGCRSSEGRPVLLETHTGISEGDTKLKDRTVRKEVTSLAADFARFMAARLDPCKRVELPGDAPTTG